MAFDPTAALSSIASKLKTQGRIRSVEIGEPEVPDVRNISAGVFAEAIRTPELVLDAPVRIYDVTVRLYLSYLQGGAQTETMMLRAVGEAMEDLEGDYDLNSTIRAVDVGGIYGSALGAEWGYLEVGDNNYRTCDISVPLIVDASAATFVA